jgi:putative transposase
MKGRVRGQVVTRAFVVATGVSAEGEPELLGLAVGATESEAFWSARCASGNCPGCAW